MFVQRLCLCLFLVLAAPAAALPWAEPGDRQLRQDVELLKAARFIRGPVDQWPLPWGQIMDGVEAAGRAPVRPHIAAAAARLARHADYAEMRTGFEVRVAATNRAAVIRGFGDTAREQADLAVRVTHNLGNLSVSYGVGYRYDQVGDDYHFEPGSAVMRLGNWALYTGNVQKYWGPGNDGALNLGNSARPFPKIGITRLTPFKPRPKFLRWVGPWRFDFYGGILTETRADAKNPVQFGMQFAFEPAPGLEIALNRQLMICGGTRSGDNPTAGGVCDAPSIVRALFPFFPGIKPGDSLAGFNISYARMIGPVAAKVYYDVTGEDKSGVTQFDQVGQTGGMSIGGPFGGDGASWQIIAEYTDTLANFWLTSRQVPGSFYNNSFYFSGKVYKGDAIGHSIDGDSSLATLAVSLTDPRNRRWYGSLRAADLNKAEALNAAGFVSNRVSANRELIHIGTGGVEWPTQYGDIRLEGRVMDNAPNSPGREPTKAEVEIGWRSRF